LLDEIGELALDLQPKLLRAIDRREIQRIGGTQRIPSTSASSRPPTQPPSGGQRAPVSLDLYYRLAVLVVTLPPLRERASDIPMIVESLLADLGARRSPIGDALTSTLVPELLRHSWPATCASCATTSRAVSSARSMHCPR